MTRRIKQEQVPMLIREILSRPLAAATHSIAGKSVRLELQAITPDGHVWVFYRGLDGVEKISASEWRARAKVIKSDQMEMVL